MKGIEEQNVLDIASNVSLGMVCVIGIEVAFICQRDGENCSNSRDCNPIARRSLAAMTTR